jgi:glutamine synthetase adenylyltransferase
MRLRPSGNSGLLVTSSLTPLSEYQYRQRLDLGAPSPGARATRRRQSAALAARFAALRREVLAPSARTRRGCAREVMRDARQDARPPG